MLSTHSLIRQKYAFQLWAESRGITEVSFGILSFLQNEKQDGRLAPAYFSPNYKYFDEFLQTVKNKTTVLILVFRVFTNQFHHWFLYFMQKDITSRFSLEKISSHSAEKIRRGTLLCFRKFLLSKNVRFERGGYQDFPSKTFCLTVPKNFVSEPFCAVFQKSFGSEKVYR